MGEREMYDFEKEWLTKYPYRLSRKFEENLPEFSSHLEARTYFKKQYGDNFMMTDSITIDGEKLYTYWLVVHRENFDKFQRELHENGYAAGTDGPLSYHPIEIWENGNIHVVY